MLDLAVGEVGDGRGRKTNPLGDGEDERGERSSSPRGRRSRARSGVRPGALPCGGALPVPRRPRAYRHTSPACDAFGWRIRWRGGCEHPSGRAPPTGGAVFGMADQIGCLSQNRDRFILNAHTAVSSCISSVPYITQGTEFTLRNSGLHSFVKK